jgi:four helix bundle suffix protein
VIIGLIRVASYLLSRQLLQLERAFMEEGGLREKMARARVRARQEKDTKDFKDSKDF